MQADEAVGGDVAPTSAQDANEAAAGGSEHANAVASSSSWSARLEQASHNEDLTPARKAGGYAVTNHMPAVPGKRSRWLVQDDDDGDGNAGDDLESQAKDARDRAAAKAARQRAKASQRQRRHEQDNNASSTSPSITGAAARNKMQKAETGQAPSRAAHPAIQSCRSIHCYERLNHIEEGSYGVVFRARERGTGEIVAIKKLKMDGEQNGFPITSLREIRTIMEGAHPNVVRVREIVVGDTLTQIFIVMDFIEHDLKTLLSSQTMPFLASEIKTLLHQLLSAMSLLHRNWIIHRDLKTSNLLMNNRGQIKVADFGLARRYGESSGKSDMTKLVVTLWYRAPELLLGADSYDTAIDMWSVGCVFAELITREPLFTGKNEVDQISKIFRLLGQPNDDTWPGFSALPHAKQFQHKQVAQPYSLLAQEVGWCTEKCLDLLHRLLTYDPRQRISADEALKHAYFTESPAPAHPDTFSTFPSIAAGEKRRSFAASSPAAPQRLADQKLAYQLEMDV